MLSRTKVEQVATHAALRAAKILIHYYKKGVVPKFKGEVDLVTQADVESQRVVVATLKKAFPTHHILAEEDRSGHQQSLEGPIWIIDPLDGTTNFSHGFPMFGVSIAFRNKGKTEFGLVYQPLLKEKFTAHRGRGAFLNGKKIRVSKISELNRALVATGFPYDRRTNPENNLNHFAYFEMAAQCVRRAGAATLDLVHVASGRLDGFWEQRLAPWDVAAGALILTEAGGTVTDFSGKPLEDLRCGELMASNKTIHAEMLKAFDSSNRFSIGNWVNAIA